MPEWIELGFGPAGVVAERMLAVQTSGGQFVWRVTYTDGLGGVSTYRVDPPPIENGGCAFVLALPTGTTVPIVSVRLDVDNHLANWQELDAVGLVPLPAP